MAAARAPITCVAKAWSVMVCGECSPSELEVFASRGHIKNPD